MRRNAIIIGGGIAGMATAALLNRAGLSCLILEQSPVLKEVGAGLQISPNGVAVLRALGLEQKLIAQGSPQAKAVSLRDYRRRGEVARLDLQRLAPDQAYYFVHRADLLALLQEAALAAGATVRLGQKVQAIGGQARPEVRLETGEILQADLVVGADGVHSTARQTLNPHSSVFFTKQVAWRAVVPNVIRQPAEARVYMGPGQHIVSYPLRGGAQVNLVAVEERETWQEEGWNIQGDLTEFRKIFSPFQGEAAALIQAVKAVSMWGLFRHPVASCWAQDGLALVGDAAHPMLPFLAQGANMALEDAWILAHAVKNEELGAYQKRREARVRRVIKTTQGNAKRYHLRSELTRNTAHRGLSMMSKIAPALMLRPFDWLYRYDVTQHHP